MESSEHRAALDLDGALLKARIKMRLVGGAREAVRLGRFELRRRCGSGAEGVVYEALDTASGSHVALKCLGGVRARSGASLRREFRSLTGIVHPNLVVLHELFWLEQQWFFTMELLSGVDFVRYVRAGQRRVQLDQLRASLAQLLTGVAAIHGAGKVHRDLKPNNVLVEPDGRVVIIDYGLVIERPKQPAPARVRRGSGTPGYMAPEQASGLRADAAVDLYAVGVMLFEALTGARPASSVKWAGQPCSRLRPSRYVDGVPSDLDALCSSLLARDPALRPSAEQALSRVTPRSPPRRSNGRIARDCFVGRERELHALHVGFAQAVSGRASVVLVHGPSGIGKSTLLRRFCAELSERGAALVLEGRCYERESTPYKVFEALVDGLVSHLNGLDDAQVRSLLPAELGPLLRAFPAFARLRAAQAEGAPEAPLQLARDHERASDAPAQVGDPAELRALAFVAITELVRAVRTRAPIVLSVDDLQWGDLDSVHLLEQLLAGPNAPALLLVGSYRRDERATSPFLCRALHEGALSALDCDLIELAVDELAAEQASELLRASLGGAPGALSEAELSACVRAARGVPFLLMELADHAGAEARDGATPVDLSALLRLRASRCSQPAQRLLELLCAAGRPLQVTLALRAARLGGAAFQAAAELSAARLARFRDTEHERCLEPYHDLIRQRFAPHDSPGRARELHAAIAAAMEELAVDQPERLVEHLWAAGDRERAAREALRAAEGAAHKLAWNRAAELFGSALAACAEGAAQRAHLHARRGEMLSFAGRYAEAAAAYSAAAQLAQGASIRDFERCAAQQHLRAGQTTEALAILRRLLHAVGLRYPEHDGSAVLLYLSGRARQWLADRVQAKPAPLRSAASCERLATLDAVHRELWFPDPLRGGLAHVWFYREARRCHDRHFARALVWEVVYAALLRGPAAAAQIARRLRQISTITGALGTDYDVALAQYAEAVYLIHCRWRPRDALALLRGADQLFARCPGSEFERGWLSLALEHALETTGNLSELVASALAREQATRGRDDASTVHQLIVSVPLALLIQDRPQSALQFLEQRWRPGGAHSTFTDYAAIGRKSNALLYLGEVAAAHALYIDEIARLRPPGALRSRIAELDDSCQRARNAAALYWQTRAARLKREVRQRADKAKGLLPLARGFFAVTEASIARADGRNADCRALLECALSDFRAMQCDHGEWGVRYRLAQLDRSADQLATAHAWLLERGVRNPEKWVSLGIPGPTGWR